MRPNIDELAFTKNLIKGQSITEERKESKSEMIYNGVKSKPK